jgi:hypothetical protein
LKRVVTCVAKPAKFPLMSLWDAEEAAFIQLVSPIRLAPRSPVGGSRPATAAARIAPWRTPARVYSTSRWPDGMDAVPLSHTASVGPAEGGVFVGQAGAVTRSERAGLEGFAQWASLHDAHRPADTTARCAHA